MNGLHLTKIENISVIKDENIILDDVSFEVHCGEITMIIGRNGAGKSTLLKAILGQIEHNGKVEFFNIDEDKNQKQKKQKDIKIGYVPQTLNIERDMPLTVYDMFASYITNKPVWIKKDKIIEDQIIEQLKVFGAEKLIDKKVGNLSGGELQRVLLAIADKPVPNLLILDEPVSGIDRNGTMEFYNILKDLKTNYDLSILLVSHDLELVKKYADRVILLDKKILEIGKPDKVFNSKNYKNIFGF